MSDSESTVSKAKRERRGCNRRLGCFVLFVLFAPCGLFSCDIVLGTFPSLIAPHITVELRNVVESYDAALSLYMSEGDISRLGSFATDELVRFYVDYCDPAPCPDYMSDGIIIRDDRFDVLEVNNTFAIVRFDFRWVSDSNPGWGWMCESLLKTDEGWKVDYVGPILPPGCVAEKYDFFRLRAVNYLIYLLSN